MNNLIKTLFLTTSIYIFTFACSQSSNTMETTTTKCPNQPQIVLESNNVKPISFDNQPITQSDMANSYKSIGYTFEAQSGQKLSYKTNQDICIWIYTPDNQILSTSNLPTTGKYTIQISALKGSTSFDLTMNLQNITEVPVSRKSNTSFSNSDSKSDSSYKQSPQEAIGHYYAYLNNSNYQKAWNLLSLELQTNKKSHPNGYKSFLQWWKQVNSIYTARLETKNYGDTATVTIRCRYNFGSGRKTDATVKYYLRWSESSQSWKINNVQRIQ